MRFCGRGEVREKEVRESMEVREYGEYKKEQKVDVLISGFLDFCTTTLFFFFFFLLGLILLLFLFFFIIPFLIN